jgi:predicted dithiol-disulfide oxidoreductase (DUF899 family)
MVRRHKVVSSDQWNDARKQLLIREKEFTQLRDELSQQRRDLPWEVVAKEYWFEGPTGKLALAELFNRRSQLIVYHFMFAPDWDEGCPSCSFWADNFNGIDIHLKHRDVSFVAVSRAPWQKLAAYRQRMGWTFDWFSSFGTEFNHDYGASFTPEELTNGKAYYNYTWQKPPGPEVVGISVFYKEIDGTLFHSYSCYARGVDMMNGAYNYIDLTPKGRDEADQKPGRQAWVRRHDQYND